MGYNDEENLRKLPEADAEQVMFLSADMNASRTEVEPTSSTSGLELLSRMNLTITREIEDGQADQYECTWAGICSNGRHDQQSFERFKARLVKRLLFKTDGREVLLWCKQNHGTKNEIIDDDDLAVAMNYALHKGLKSLLFTIQDPNASQDVSTRATRTNFAKPVPSLHTRNADHLTGGRGTANSHGATITSPPEYVSPIAAPAQAVMSIPISAVYDERTEFSRLNNGSSANEFASLTRLARGVNNAIRAIQGRDLLHDWSDC